MASAGTVTLNLDANSVKLLRELQKTEKASRRTASGMQKSMTRAFRGITRVARLASVGVGASLGLMITRAINAADQMAKLRDRLGISTEAMSELKFAAEQTGVSFQTLSLGLQRMQRRVAEAAKGTGEAKAALKELGIDAQALSRLPLEKQFSVIADRLLMVGSSADKTRLAMKLFDSEGVALLQTIKGGSAGLAEFGKQARDLGAVVTDETANAAAEAKDQVNALKTAFDGLALNLTSTVAPALAGFTKNLNTALFGTDIAKAERRIEKITASLQQESRKARFTALAESGSQFSELGVSQPVIDRLVRELQQEVENLERIKSIIDDVVESTDTSGIAVLGNRSSTDAANALFSSAEKDLEKEIQRADADFKSFADSLKTADDELADYARTIERFKDQLTDEQFREALRQLEEMRMEGLQEIDLGPIRALKKEIKEVDAGTTELGFTFQSAFEDAIIEGEKLRDVMQGLLKDILRIAIRSSITGPLGESLGGFFSKIFGGPKAAGGPVSAGTGYLVGEKGPELFVPQSNGNIIPNGAGGASVTYNIDARGADEARIMRVLPPILERNRQQTIAEIQGLKMQGRF